MRIGSYGSSAQTYYGAKLIAHTNFGTTANADLSFDLGGLGEVMRLHSSGSEKRVGIGEDAPSTLLSLKGGADTSIITLKCTKNDSSWSGERIGGINFFSEDGSGPGAGIRGSINYVAASSSGGDTAMNFATGDNSTKMTIDNDGKVGIGTDAPDKRLTVGGVNATEGINLKTKSGANVWTLWSLSLIHI